MGGRTGPGRVTWVTWRPCYLAALSSAGVRAFTTSSANLRWPASSFSAKSYALATTSSGLGSLSASGTFTDGSLGVTDWTVSTQVLIASMTVSWLLRTVFRISSCTSCWVLGMMCALLFGFVVANYTKHRVGMSSGVLGIGSSA